MQGPEQGLVGEIALATELRRHLERKISEARREWWAARTNGSSTEMSASGAVHAALAELKADFDRISKERSDLANSKILPE